MILPPADTLQYPRPPTESIWLPVFLSLVVHGVALLLLLGVINWHPPKQEPISVSLVDATIVPLPAPAPPASGASEPLPATPPTPLPAPPDKVDIPIPTPPKRTQTKAPAEQPKPVPKPVPKPTPEAKPNPLPKKLPALDKAYDKLLDSQLTDESQDISEAKMQDLLKTIARQKEMNHYLGQIRDKIRANIRKPENLQGDPQSQFEVIQLPTGEILRVTVLRSSGIPILDQAVEQAIWKSAPLPRPDDPALFDRRLILTFRPLSDR